MDVLSLAASVIAVIQLVGSCLKLSRKFLGPSEFGSSDLSSMIMTLYGFNGVMKSFQTHLEIHEDDEARLSSFEYLKPVLEQCEKALHTIEDFVGKNSFIGKHVIGPRFDYKLKASLKALDRAKELFMLALHADQRYPLPPPLTILFLTMFCLELFYREWKVTSATWQKTFGISVMLLRTPIRS